MRLFVQRLWPQGFLSQRLLPKRLLPKDKEIGWVPYLWLIYLTGILVSAWLGGATVLEWVLTVLGILVFCALYFAGYWVQGRKLVWIIALIALLGILYAPINPGASAYFIYAGAFAGRVGRPAVGGRILAVLVLIILLESILFRLPPHFWIIAVVFTLIIGAVGVHYAQANRDNRRLLMAQEEIEHLAKIAERERIARDLHDVLGHTLTVIVLKSELASKLTEKDPVRAAQEIKDVERISRDALAQVRNTIRGYQVHSLRTEADQATAALQAAGVKVQCDFASPALSAAQEGVLALALREAVTNVIRHASATSCNLTLRQENGMCELEIRDDGSGRLAPEGLGLTGMRQRVEALGGRMHRDGTKGTRLSITVPNLPAGLP